MSDDELNGNNKRPAGPDFETFGEDEEDSKQGFESDNDMVDEDGNFVGELDLSKAGTQAWLVKIPKFLHERWSTVNEEGIDLGKVRIFNQINPKDPDASTFQLLLPSTPLTANLPKGYNISMGANPATNAFVFSEPTGPHPKPPHLPGYPTGKASAIVATIKHECGLTPHQNSKEYREIMRARNVEATKVGRSLQRLGEKDKDPTGGRGGMFLASMTTRGGFIQKKAKVQMDQKTTRMPRNELTDLLFSAFEKYPYWSFKGLCEYCKQPQTYLKEVLGDLCNLIKRGPYASKYEIKEEYKGQIGREAAKQGIKPAGSSSSSTSRAEQETTFDPTAVGLSAGEKAHDDPDLADALDDDDEEFDDEDDEDLVEVGVQ